MTQRHLLIFLLFASLGALGTALIAQFAFKMHPCELCILQRWPYVAVALLTTLGLAPKHLLSDKIVIVLCIVALFIGGGIATYHAGVEKGIFPGPTGCSNNATAGASLEDIRNQILNAPLVTCAQAMGYFLGLSFAAWNALASFALIIISLSWYKKSHAHA